MTRCRCSPASEKPVRADAGRRGRRRRRPRRSAEGDRGRRGLSALPAVELANDLATDLVTVTPGVSHRPWYRGRIVQVAVVVAVMVVVYRVARRRLPVAELARLERRSRRSSTSSSRGSSTSGRPRPQSPFFTVFDGFATFVDNLVALVHRRHPLAHLARCRRRRHASSVLRFGGVRAAVIIASAFASFALLGLWEASMETLALMLAAVGLSLLDRRSRSASSRAAPTGSRRAIYAVLDAMQIIPAFAYLMPVVILFSIGPAAAVVSTMVYAIPPAIRITALGIRGVADEHRRGGRVDGRDAPADAREGAAAARPADAAARRQPDDPLRPLDGRDRGPDRRRRPRRRRRRAGSTRTRRSRSSAASRS